MVEKYDASFVAQTANMQRWTQENPDLYYLLAQSKGESTASMDRLGLPRCGLYGASIDEAYRLTEIPASITTDLVVWHLLPKNPQDKRIVRLKIPRTNALEQLRADITALPNPEEYSVLLSDYYENAFGGQVVITERGTLLVEFGKGPQGDFAAGEKTPDYTATNNQYTGGVKYSFEDPELRKAIWNMLELIYRPREKPPTPGYYEFALYANTNGKLSHVFFDARTGRSEDPFSTIPDSSIAEVGGAVLSTLFLGQRE